MRGTVPFLRKLLNGSLASEIERPYHSNYPRRAGLSNPRCKLLTSCMENRSLGWRSVAPRDPRMSVIVLFFNFFLKFSFFQFIHINLKKKKIKGCICQLEKMSRAFPQSAWKMRIMANPVGFSICAR
jgi:hypothetical protein